MEPQSTRERDCYVTIGFTGLFLVLNLFIPVLKIAGGFIRDTLYLPEYPATISLDYYWDKITLSLFDIPLLNFEYGSFVAALEMETKIGIIWQIIPIWGYVFFFGSIIGAILVSYPSYKFLTGQMTPNKPLAIYGGILAIIVSVIEHLLFIFLITTDDVIFSGSELNFLLLFLAIIGWFLLMVASFKSIKPNVQSLNMGVKTRIRVPLDKESQHLQTRLNELLKSQTEASPKRIELRNKAINEALESLQFMDQSNKDFTDQVQNLIDKTRDFDETRITEEEYLEAISAFKTVLNKEQTRFWYCPNDRTKLQVLYTRGTISPYFTISKDYIDVGINNAIAMRKINSATAEQTKKLAIEIFNGSQDIKMIEMVSTHCKNCGKSYSAPVLANIKEKAKVE